MSSPNYPLYKIMFANMKLNKHFSYVHEFISVCAVRLFLKLKERFRGDEGKDFCWGDVSWGRPVVKLEDASTVKNIKSRNMARNPFANRKKNKEWALKREILVRNV